MMDSNSFLMMSVSSSPIGKAVIIVGFVIFVRSAETAVSLKLDYTVSTLNLIAYYKEKRIDLLDRYSDLIEAPKNMALSIIYFLKSRS